MTHLAYMELKARVISAGYANDIGWYGRAFPACNSWLVSGSAEFMKAEGSVEDDTCDRVTLTGDIRWVALANQRAVKGK